MTSLEDSHRFAAALEGCSSRVRAGEALEACLADYPTEYRDELARLVPLGQRLARLRRDPSPEFQARLEQRLLGAVEEARRSRREGRWGGLARLFVANPAFRTAAIVALVLVFLGGSGLGVDQAAAGSLPDSPLYRVKTVKEAIQLALARSPEAQVEVNANQIQERGSELEKALRARKPGQVIEALAVRLARATDQMVTQALDREAKGNPQPAVRARQAIRTMLNRIDRLLPQAGPELRPALERMRTFLLQQERRLQGGAVRARARM